MRIIIQGNPVCQARMRHVSRGKFVQVYDPNSAYKKKIRSALSYDGIKFERPRISFLFHMPIPKSTPKKLLPFYESGLLKHCKKFDVDNGVKLYLDILDGIYFDGDQAVSLGPCIKVYHKDPKTIIWIRETAEMMDLSELDTFYGALESSI